MKFLDDPTDLSQLTHADPKVVERLVEKLNTAGASSKKRVIAIGTGGTISMKIENGKRIPDLDFDRIMRFTHPNLTEQFDVQGLDLFIIASPDMNYSHVRDVAISICYLWQHLEHDIAGFLVCHGTDTMTYSAAAISLMMGQGMPFSVVYTGAQKPIQAPGSDAPNNLQNALYTLEALYDNNMAEVVVAMGDRAVLGTSSEKVDGLRANAFDAPIHKHVAHFDDLEYPPILASWLKPKREQDFNSVIWDENYSHTLIVKSHLGLSPEMIKQQVKDPQIKAVILYSYGAGTAYTPMIDIVSKTVKEENKPVFIVSPVNAEIKPAYESTHYMIECGITPLFMTLSAALAKMEVAIRLHAGDTKKITEFMTTNYVGEIPTEQSRFVDVR